MPSIPSVATASLSPWEAARRLRDRTGLIYLDSALSQSRSLSILAVDPVEVYEGHLAEDAAKLRQILHKHRRHASPDLGVPSGGLFGWVGFEGQYVLGLYPRCSVYQHDTGTWLAGPPEDGAVAMETQARRLSIGGEISAVPMRFSPLMDKETFCGMVRRAQEYIAAGDIYQVNLSYPWSAPWPKNLEPWDFYERLREQSPAPYGAYLDLAGVQVFSASPECFLKMSGRHILTHPIKGTRPRGATPAQDADLARELVESPKERAELVMITDLERNDLGQVCEYGSVEVTALLRLERYAQVQHLVSAVEGRLRENVDYVDAFAACFPGGSISGAPKKRALEIIRELEPHQRGIYTGAIGGFGFNGESMFNIAIRTAWREDDIIQFHTGAGIVADSDPEREWEETRHKAAGILQAAQ